MSAWNWRRKLLLPLLFGAVMIPAAPEAAQKPGNSGDESRFISRARQLTFEGRRAGEGYFSSDGRMLVFQSEREPGNPFYQIYALDFESGETRRVSAGPGKTTCAFFQHGTGDILFASTHHDPRSEEYQRAELDFRASGKQRRYEWDYDPEMELYVAGPAELELTRLTRARGYDAEASFSPDGRWIVFSSNRHAYAGALDDEERKRLEIDPSYFLDLYVMRADGSETRRLTQAPGYDGGPFFSPDGERIVWRRFDEGGLIADIWSMNLDGSDPLRITDFASMSWAPYPHPSGQYILFTSNKLGFDNFELFIVDTAGLREPVRVSHTPGFDGLPVPSPDGKRLAWTTSRNGESAQIYIAEWSHENALAALKAAPKRGGAEKPGKISEFQRIRDRLREIGATPLPGRDDFDARSGGHLLAYLPARTRSGDGAAEAGAVVLGTCAGDDDSGSAAADQLLAVAAGLAEGSLARPVMLVFWAAGAAGCPAGEDPIRDAGIPLERTVAYVNVAPPGRGDGDRIRLEGIGSSTAWPRLVEQTNVALGFDVRLEPGAGADSTIARFQRAGVPAVALQAFDRPGGAEGNAAELFAVRFVRKLAGLEQAPVFQAAATEAASAAGGGGRPYTGTVPDYASGVSGLRLDGVIDGGPAASAGLRAGDVIVEFGGIEITGIEDYARALDEVVIGRPVEVVFLREGETLRVEITPDRRD